MNRTRRSLLVQLASLGVLAACTKDPTGGAAGDSSPPGDSAPSGDSGASIDACDRSVFSEPGECAPYPPDGEGPFYREDIPERSQLNVWEEEGERVVVLIRVLQACEPVEGVRVEMWAASQDGPYDTESADANGYGAQTTDADGVVCFDTLRPPNYRDPSSETDEWLAAHFHLKLWQGETLRGVTQIRFEVDDYRDDFAPEELHHAVDHLSDDLGRMVVDIELG